MATAKVIIQGENRMKSALKGAKGDITGFSSSITKLGSVLKKAFAVTAVVAGVKKLGSALKNTLTNDFAVAHRAYKQLSIALGNDEAYKSVVDNISRLTKETLSGKDEIERMASELAALGKSADEINLISDAAVSLSNVTGKDLSSAMTMLMSASAGNTAQLRKLGINLDGVSKKELEAGKACEIVRDKFSSLSKEISKSDINQSFKNMKETWGEIRETIGGTVHYIAGDFIRSFDSSFEEISEKIKGVVHTAGAVIKNLPEVFSRTLSLLWDMVKRTFEWDSLKVIFKTVMDNLVIMTEALLKGIFVSIPKILWNVIKGLGEYIAYLGVKIKDTILLSIQNAINAAGEKLKSTWFGKTFGLGGNLAKVSFNITGDKADELKAKADKSFEDIAPIFRESIDDAINTARQIAQNNISATGELYGDLIEGFTDDIDSIISPDLEKIRIASDASKQSSSKSALSLKSIEGEMKSGSFLERLSQGLGKLIGGKGASDKQIEKFSSSFSSGIATAFGSLGEMANSFSSNIASMGASLGVFATLMKYVADGIAQTAMGAIENLYNMLIEPLLEAGRVIGNLIVPILEALGNSLPNLLDSVFYLVDVLAVALRPVFDFVAGVIENLKPVFDMLASIITNVAYVLQPIGAILQDVLSPVLMTIGILMQSLAPIIRMITYVFEALSPVMKAFAYIVTAITGTISWIIQWIGHVFAAAYNTLFGWLFGKMSDPGSPGSYSSYMQEQFAGIDAAFQPKGTQSTSLGTSASTAVSSASYQGGTSVTINIYQEAPVVGNGGMREFAKMIWAEYEALDYYGVSI